MFESVLLRVFGSLGVEVDFVPDPFLYLINKNAFISAWFLSSEEEFLQFCVL